MNSQQTTNNSQQSTVNSQQTTNNPKRIFLLGDADQDHLTIYRQVLTDLLSVGEGCGSIVQECSSFAVVVRECASENVGGMVLSETVLGEGLTGLDQVIAVDQNRRRRSQHPLPIIIILEQENFELAVEVMKKGVADCFCRSLLSLEKLQQSIQTHFLTQNPITEDLSSLNTLETANPQTIEQRLHQIQERYQIATQTAKVGVWEWNLQTNEFYLDANVKAFLGYKDHEIPNDLQEWVKYIHPEDEAGVMQAATDYLEGKTTEYRYEHRMLHKDGSSRWILVCGELLYDESGTPVRMIGSDTDISDRKIAELQIQESQNRFQRLASHAPGIIYQFVLYPDKSYRFVYMSDRAAEIFEHSGEAISQDVQLVFGQIHPQDRPSLDQTILHSAQTLTRWQWEGRILPPSGKLKWFQGMSQPEKQPDGSILWDGIIVDITQRKQVEEELQQQRYFMQQVAATSPSMLYLYDIQKKCYCYTNQTVEQFLKISPEEITKIDIDKLFKHRCHPQDLPKVYEHLSKMQTAQTGEILDYEFRFQSLEGHWHWFQSYETVFTRNEAGEVVQVLGTTHDMTSRKEAEAEVRHQQDLREAIFNESTDALFLVASNTLLTLDCNQRAVELFAVSQKNDLMGLEWRQFQNNPFTSTDMKQLRNQLKNNRFWTQEVEYKTHQKKTFWGSAAIKPIQVDNQFLYLVRITDISDRKKAELQLRKSQAHLLTAQRIANLGSWEYYPKNDQVILSKETLQIFGRDPKKFNTTLEEITQKYIHPEERNLLKTEINKAITQKTYYTMECRFFRENGELGYFSARGETLSNEKGKVVGLIGTILDITEQKKFEKKLQNTNVALLEATKLKDEFLATMSHELRTPLNSILGLSEALTESVYGELNNQQHYIIQSIEKSGRHLLELINDILDLSKMEAGKLKLNITKTTLQELCESCLDVVMPLASRKQIDLQWNCPKNSPLIQVDELRIRQLLINLLSNGIKFTPEQGKVNFCVGWEQQKRTKSGLQDVITFSVSDTGIGLSATAQEKLFQPFIQIDSRLSRKHSGTGLGLVLVKNIAELHGGWVTVESELNQGSCFTVVIPTQFSFEESNVVSPPTVSAKSLSQSPLIVLFDNHPEASATLSDYLEVQGYSIQTIADSENILSHCQNVNPHLILFNENSLESETVNAIAAIRTTPNLSQMPIIVLSHLLSPPKPDPYHEAGANLVLTQPVRLKQLLQEIQALLDATDTTPQYCSLTSC